MGSQPYRETFVEMKRLRLALFSTVLVVFADLGYSFALFEKRIDVASLPGS